MVHWYSEKKELRLTPSQQAGLPHDTEMRYRREGARFILELGKALGLSHNTMATGAVYYHRFYMFHSFQSFPKYVVATCCLFLAGKAEETPKKCKDLIRTVRTLTNDTQFATFGVDPREEVMVIERVLLQTIKFDLQVDHPYSSLIKYAKCLQNKGDSQKLQKMVQMSWTFVNDSLCTTLCLQWEAEIIAVALMYLAAKLSKFEVKDWNGRKEWHKHWWDQYIEGLDVDILEDICHQVLDLYAQPHTPAKEQPESPPPGTRQQRATAASTGAAPQHSQRPPPSQSLPPQTSSSSSARASSSQQPPQQRPTAATSHGGPPPQPPLYPPPPSSSSRKATPPPPPPPPKSRPHTPPPIPQSVGGPPGGAASGSVGGPPGGAGSRPPPPPLAAQPMAQGPPAGGGPVYGQMPPGAVGPPPAGGPPPPMGYPPRGGRGGGPGPGYYHPQQHPRYPHHPHPGFSHPPGPYPPHHGHGPPGPPPGPPGPPGGPGGYYPPPGPPGPGYHHRGGHRY